MDEFGPHLGPARETPPHPTRIHTSGVETFVIGLDFGIFVSNNNASRSDFGLWIQTATPFSGLLESANLGAGSRPNSALIGASATTGINS